MEERSNQQAHPEAVQNVDSESPVRNEGEGEEIKYSSVAIKPVKSNKMSAVSRIKAIQENDWKTWAGV